MVDPTKLGLSLVRSQDVVHVMVAQCSVVMKGSREPTPCIGVPILWGMRLQKGIDN